MAFRDTWKRMNWLRVASVVTLAYATWIVWVLGWERIRDFFQNAETDLNAVGDFLAGTFAPVALIWLCAAVFTQRQELNDTRDQFTENKRVTDEQLKVIHSQNALLSLQHNQAVENAKQAYRLSLFDKRFQIYEKFIKFGHYHENRSFNSTSYSEMTNLAHEAGFVFDFEIQSWFEEIADKIEHCIILSDEHPPIYDPYEGRLIGPTDEKGVKALQEVAQYKNWIRAQFDPPYRTNKFWKFMSVSDQPYTTG